jgi:amino acid adenylation domain-containing protein/non-ribosomal peptide synthase protein (TIGR01720 family)
MMTQKGGDYTVELATEKDLHRIWQWNSTVFEPVDICIHHLISNAARQHPDNLAVHAWDGVWTYKQLDDLSTRLAHRLLGLGLEHNFVAPLLFEKSRWFPVAALGVMKAGGASVAMDADQPEERLAAIVGQLKPAVMLCSSAQRDAAGRLAGAARVQEVAEASLLAPAQRQTGEEQQLSSNDNLPMVSPNDKLYINFTSGSTGTPKGVVVTHSNFSSAIQYQQQIHGFKSTSRVYDFASYAFDVSWSNVLHTLTCGACLCIPSDTERKDDLVGSIERYQATHLDVTPSVARLLPRKTFLQLETLVLGGEKVPEEAQDWAASVTVKNPYGPSECTPTATIATVVSRDRNNPHAVFKSTIGKGVGVNTWVVDAETGNSLVAVGATGELWLEGPIVGAGYIGDPEKTAASFVEDPIWLLRGVHGGVGSGHVGRFGRLYKTGDLVRYNEDGSLEFIGRKDSQVKINGQRVELGEIEHHIWAALQLQGQGEPRQPFRQVAAEIVVPQQSSKAILVAFLEAGRDGTHGAPATSDADKHEQGEPEPRQGLYSLAKDEVSGLRETLAARVPGYMIPSTYISLNSFPLTQTGKVDRKKLRAIAEVEALALAFDRQDDATSDENVPQRPPTAREAQLLHLWHSVLGLQPGIIGINDSFLRLGGDSIAAMKLSGALRELGLSLTVADIFTHPRLEDMAKVAGSTIEEEEEPISPYSLLPAQVDLNRARQEAAQLCGLPADQIEDIFPCTPLQEGLLALTAKRPGDYIVRYSLELEKGVDHQRLKAAWDSVIASTPILRTRIVNLQGYGLVQVVVSEFPSLQLATGAEIVADRAQLMGLNTPLARFHVVRQPGHESKLLFVWELHHAVFDGWSIRLVIDKLESIYKGDPAHQTPGFQRFVKHVQLIEGDAHAETFWKSQLEGLDTEVFPALPQSGYQPKADGRYKHDMSGLRWPSEGITASSIVRAATSIMVAAYSNSRDVVFGATVTGRQAAVPGVEQMTGPTIATIPVRISLDPSTSLQDYLQQIQSQSIETTPFEQMGLQRIRKVSPDAERACDFQLLLVVQPTPEEGEETASAVFAHGQADLEAGDRLSAGELDTYAITLECHLDDEGAQLHVSFDTNVVAPEQARRMAQSLEYILCQICHVGQGDDLRIADIEALSTEDAHNIWAWNGAVPEAADVCIHELFTSTARRRPNALAVSAWDGDFTYSQLDNLSTRLAHRLISLNVGPDTVVPLLFDKSKWMSVAVLAVMKAGGCSVAMDSDQPQERLRLIAQQVGPVVVVLCSQGKKELAGQVTTGAVIEEIDQTRFSPLAPPSTMIPMAAKGALPVVNPASRLYVVFTSGSTGTPKGVTVTHSNFSSAIKHQQYAHGFRRSSRVYDFASYTFDVSWSNMLNTFTSGGCLCVPSEAERKGDLAKSIERFRTTHLDITPSVARILPLDLFKQLETLVLGGERLLEEDVKRWAPLVTVKNPYGPCECTPTATLATVNARNLDQYTSSISIGKGLGLNTWVVSSDGSSLAPIGAVGELWLEGPLVGAGYIDEPEKTAAAFIEDPAWLLRGVGHGHAVGGRPGRLYRTGDLVRYKDDYGNLEFVGRKDAQVKINGQRVELGEIEGQMVRLKEIRQAACLLPRSGPCANKLVAVFSLQGTEQGNDKHESTMFAAVKGAHIDQHLVAMQSLLRETLPTYMTPTLWITLESLPLNASGKLDRRKIQAWLSEMDMDTFNKVVRTDDDDEEVASSGRESKVEHVLRDICSRVLNVPSESINMKRSFISNGGDSISAMRLSSESRAANLVFSVADLLKSKSLAGFARGLETVIPTAAPQEEEEFDVDFSLTPIQQWFFAQGHQWDSTPAGSFCNQGFYLKVTRNISPEKLAEAVAAVVANHSMLRARFHRSETDGAWMQRVSKPDPSISRLTSLQLSSMSDVESLAMERHRSLDLKNGPVFSADLCTLDSQDQYLILVAHHLVVDLVSWRVILDDLETVLNGGTIQPGLPFQLWTRAQGERAANINYGDTLSTEGVNNDLDFWHFTPTTPNALMDHDVRHVDIDQQTTSLVFGDVNSILGTEPVDLLLSAVWVAFLHVFPERSGLSIFSEGHGREAADLDLSRTVGWFTTISPIHVSRDVILKGPNGSTFNTVRSVKDARRRLPSNGWAYFASSFLTEAGRNALKSDDLSAMEVVFNYHGKFQQLEEGASLFENVDLKNVVEQGPAVPASSLFGVEVSIEGGMVHYEFSFNRYLNHQDRISQWFDQVGPSLRSICNMLESTTVSRTVCDYEFLSVDYPTLDDFHGRMVPAIRSIHQSEIEDVYPCSPTVDGILLSQQRQPESYKTVQLYEIRSPNPIDLDKLCEAWQKVVAHQPTLRSIFITGLDATAAFNQVVLEHCLAEIVVLPSGQGNRDMAMNSLTQLPPVTYQELQPLHRVAACQVSDNMVLWQVEMSHAITDGASTAIIGQDLIAAYTGTLNASVELLDTTRNFVRSLVETPNTEKMSYWKSKLTGAEPSHFPHISGDEVNETRTIVASIQGPLFQRIQSFCTAESVTVGSLLNSAWALTLAAYIGSESVCFGYLASGRDLPIQGLNDSVGAYANMMTCYVHVLKDLAGPTFVRHVHDQVMQDLGYQHCSLAAIQHELDLQGRPLFNTIVSFQKQSDDVEDSTGPLHFKVLDGLDPTEVSLSLFLPSVPLSSLRVP